MDCNIHLQTIVVFMTDTITLTNAERMELNRRATSRTDRAEDARRARLILLLADGHTWDDASDRLDCSRGFVARGTRRFAEQRIAGLYSRHVGHAAHAAGRRDAVEHTQTGGAAPSESHDGGTGVAQAWAQTPPGRAL